MKTFWRSLLSAVLVLAVATGCSSSSNSSSGELETITVAATPSPHAEILEHVSSALEEKGYTLKVTEYTDYVQPNNVVESEEFDCNYFQHVPYMDQFNEENKTHLAVAGKIHYEPMGVYKGQKDAFTALEKGDVIGVPNDTTNEARALLLLQTNGVIKLKEGITLNATVKDIEENKYGVEIKELEAAQVPKNVKDMALVVANGNYAIQEGLTLDDTIAIEESDSDAAKTYVNIIAVKEGNENSDKIKALVEVLTSDDTKKWITDNYKGSVLPYEE